jgi:hypothetical protein
MENKLGKMAIITEKMEKKCIPKKWILTPLL